MLGTEEQIFKQIDKASNILLVFSSDWEADAVAASLALYLFLNKQGKTVTVAAINNEKKQKSFNFLPGSSDIKNNLSHLRKFIVSLDISKTSVSQIKYVVDKNQLNFIVSPEEGWFEQKDVSSRAGDFRYDLIICLGANDLESLGELYDKNIEFFYKTPLINLSCQAANEEFGQINYVDINCSTVSELVYNILKAKNENLIDENIATNLLAGIILQTKNFKSGKLTPETLIITSQLIKLGGRREEIVKQLYRNRRISDLKIWGKILQNLKIEKKGLAWALLMQSDFDQTAINLDSLKDLIDELMSGLTDTDIVLIMIEKEDKTDLIAFSLKNTSALDYLKTYNGQGNNKIAIATSNNKAQDIISQLLA
jgi:nanoRNase/pAp phosphatase (c-di-AMP/oligoRNAs hydrolase)